MAIRTSDILKEIDIPRHKLYYLEQKGYINPSRIPMGDLEYREYTETDIELIKAIWKFLKMGFKHKTAHERALKEVESLPLDFD